MKRFILFMLFLLLVCVKAQSQQDKLASLRLGLKNAANDTMRMDAYFQLVQYYNEINADSALVYQAYCLPIAQKLKLKLNEAHILENRGFMLTRVGNYPKALESFLLALKTAEDPASEKYTWNLPAGSTPHTERLSRLGYTHLTLGHLYGATGNIEKQISSYIQANDIAESIQHRGLSVLANYGLGNVYLSLSKLDSALLFEQIALGHITKSGSVAGRYDGAVLVSIGKIYQKKGNFDLAMDAFQKALKLLKEQNNINNLGWLYISLSDFYQTINKPDSNLLYANKSLETYKIVGNSEGIANAYFSLSSAYSQQKSADSAFAFLKLATELKDSLNNVQRKNLLAFQNLGFDEQMRIKNLEDEKVQTKTKIRMYALLAGIAGFMLVTFLMYRNSRHRKKANELLQKQKEEIAKQKENVEQTLVELRSTQAQLIQSEKMASLGELTAGIAHEIQNPLNFVNNFSEVNSELIAEMKEELNKGKFDEAKNIANDIDENEQKIIFHGKRADAIVKGMLQHSRSSSSGQKELTDINALCDEYLRLAYHGLRAKDKSFNAEFKTDFDNSIGKIDIVPQDIGRVVLNLINNAFYAVNEKAKQNVPGYEPTVNVSTKNENGKVIISIKDNGKGIPDAIREKIFQPFFTTKPTGQGTGLGLSLSYDIIKAHGGELKVESKEGEGSEFIIQLGTN